MNDKVITYQDWLEDPFNEGRSVDEYIEEVCTVPSGREVLEEQVAYWEKYYLKNKNNPKAKQTARDMVTALKRVLKPTGLK